MLNNYNHVFTGYTVDQPHDNKATASDSQAESLSKSDVFADQPGEI